jgi:hypothetical protein
MSHLTGDFWSRVDEECADGGIHAMLMARGQRRRHMAHSIRGIVTAMARDLIAERAAQLAAKRAEKPPPPFLPDLSYKPLASTPCKDAGSAVYQRALYLQGKKIWADHGLSEDDFKRHIAEARRKTEEEALRHQGR